MDPAIFLDIVYRIVRNDIVQLGIILAVFFFLFEILPLFFGVQSTIRKNLPDLFRFQVLRHIYVQAVGGLFFFLVVYFHLHGGALDITGHPLWVQVIVTYLCIDFVIYFAHYMVHNYRVPLFSKAHRFHHTIHDDLQWVNSRKEHTLVLALFAFVFVFVQYVVFKASPWVVPINVFLFLLFNAFSHYHVPITVPVLDQIFLFPKHHKNHHVQRSGPYGVTLSLFDTIFGTRSDYEREA